MRYCLAARPPWSSLQRQRRRAQDLERNRPAALRGSIRPRIGRRTSIRKTHQRCQTSFDASGSRHLNTPPGSLSLARMPSLEAQQRHDGQTYKEIIDGVRQDTGSETSGLFIDPRPEDAAPADADQPHDAIAVRQSENQRTHEGRRKKSKFSAENRKEQSAKHEFFEQRSEDHIFEQADHRQRA